ncbi:hypothetical protein D0Z07_7449 [Hyphodiscus hymeniophilus]|uniref:Mmc1 C-terminal domain-containing protein n=1 Tax=Hyphodiscus hymeniophilus TaxID=353542 RepID=A0A9P7AU52_9HELO|nr:hypothetical protein D0Z07_7449 [Hyphodiscus hymeniophilus]
MPPRLPRLPVRQFPTPLPSIAPKFQHICPICSISKALRPKITRRRPTSKYQQSSRQQSQLPSISISNKKAPIRSPNPRLELREALADLRKYAGSYVNISRLQLALRGLDQPAGQETLRVAVLGWRNSKIFDGKDDATLALREAKRLLRLLLADPLKPEEEWERILTDDDPESKPLLLKVGHNDTEGLAQSNTLVRELNVSSPILNGHKLEILVLDMSPPLISSEQDEGWSDLVLVPTMEIPTSSSGRHTPVTTPVHKSLIVTDGIFGAASVQQYPLERFKLIEAAVNFQSLHPDRVQSPRYQVIDIEKATSALRSFRQSVDNAITYEQDWFASGLPDLLAFFKDGTSSGGSMRAPLQGLIETLIEKTISEINNEEARRRTAAISTKISPSKAEALRGGLSQWAERAHTELLDSLDIAFNGRRWRKLGWWKLFWRVDDVSMIATDILNQRFLTDAEREVIYLAGRIDEALSKDAAITFDRDWAYRPVIEQESTVILTHAPPPKLKDLIETKDDSLPRIKLQPWPVEITTTRALLASDTVPALQALAQKLVLQTITTSTFSSAFAVLIYVSTSSTSLYEAGAVAALGIVWSLRRMQGKWETARTFWEGEVREEGRKSVRVVENVITNALVQPDRPLEGSEERAKAREALMKAQNALETYR